MEKERPVIRIEDDLFATELKEYLEIKDDINDKTKRLKNVESDIKSVGLNNYIEYVKNNRENPVTIELESKEGDKIQFVISDRYPKLTDKKEKILREKWGDDIIKEEDIYSFNNKIFLKHKDDILKVLMDVDFLTTEEKEQLLEVKKVKSIKKGIIKESVDRDDIDIEELFKDVQPVTTIKVV
jgi:hypothetical protein